MPSGKRKVKQEEDESTHSNSNLGKKFQLWISVEEASLSDAVRAQSK
jgi:hypothetical protein